MLQPVALEPMPMHHYGRPIILLYAYYNINTKRMITRARHWATPMLKHLSMVHQRSPHWNEPVHVVLIAPHNEPPPKKGYITTVSCIVPCVVKLSTTHGRIIDRSS